MILLAVAVLLAGSTLTLACPFCSAVSQTLSQEIAAADVSVIARLVELPPEVDPTSDDPIELDLDDPDSGTAEFEVIEILHSGDQVKETTLAVGDKIKVVYFGTSYQDDDGQPKSFLINGQAGKKIDWSTPLPLTQSGIDYVKTLGTLPEKGAERLAFFLNHLEDKDPLLAQDAYDEFGRAPYETVVAIGDQMDRQQLIGWIEDSRVGPTRRRLYLTMLGICGQAEDIAILESLLLYDYAQMKPGIAANFALMSQTGPVFGASILNEMVKADVRRKQQCLDALIAAYLKLKGPDGLPLIEQKFLSNPAVEYTHVYAAVMALRFHGEETDSIPKERLLKSVRLLLENADIADQVIPDLARWEDWTVMDQLVEMFKTSDKNSWVRQPVISYLIAATDQPAEVSERAEVALAELEQLDPEAVKRARSYMAFGALARMGSKKTAPEKPGTEKSATEKTGADTPGTAQTAAADAPDQSAAESSAPKNSSETLTEQEQTTAAAVEKPEAAAAATTPIGQTALPAGPSKMLIIGGPLVAGLLLFGIFALLLRGGDVRSSSSE
ncbi:MAG: hypothetical protein ACR2NM_13490 [Bythopirellula sp.]